MPRPRGPDAATLRRKSPLPVWVQFAWRAGLVLGLLFLAILVHWLERDGLKDSHDGTVSFLDVVYFTMISITTTGYGDIVRRSPAASASESIATADPTASGKPKWSR